jgi:spermidine synthase
MIPWRLLDRAELPGGGVLTLHARGTERVIRLDGKDLMGSRMHGSEDALAERGLSRSPKDARVLIGGLGLGFTLRAALDAVGPDATVVVAELSPKVLEWNQTELAHFADRPLDDPRTSVVIDDVKKVIDRGGWDAILLDVDNGPAAMAAANAGLYGRRSLERTRAALSPHGVLGIWSAGEAPWFTNALARVGFRVEVVRVPARGKRGGPGHVLWIGEKLRERPVDTDAAPRRARRLPGRR